MQASYRVTSRRRAPKNATRVTAANPAIPEGVTGASGSARSVTPADGGPALWWAPLDVRPVELEYLSECLTAAERDRAQRFHRPLDGQRFLAARGWLRHALARELRCAPRDVPIVQHDGAKPRIDGSELHFNASRSANAALYATSWEREVGVDIEAIAPAPDLEAVAARFFSESEQRTLASLAADRRLVGFFECWTRKEAYVKGTGEGLTFPIATVDLWSGSDAPARVAGWSVHRVDVAPGFVAALAGAGDGEWVPNVPRELTLPGTKLPGRRAEIP